MYLCGFRQRLNDISCGMNHKGVDRMQQRAKNLQDAPIYVTANSLMSKGMSLEFALQVAQDAGADGFEVRRELLPQDMQSDEVRELRSHLSGFRVPPIYSTPKRSSATKVCG